MLDNWKIDYILSFYSHFMTSAEAEVMKSYINSTRTISSTSDIEVEKRLKNAYDQFRLKTAERIKSDNIDKIYFNTCPKCGKLARTPQAKRCIHCDQVWHNQVVATFQILSAFDFKAGSMFFVLGEHLTGKIKIGMKADLTILEIANKPIIRAIEFARHNDYGVVYEDTGLGFSDLSQGDKEILKSKSPFMTPIFIEVENAS